MISIQSKIKGALYGFAIGDAMGATTEFMSASEIKRVYGQLDQIIGGGWLRLKPGEITDDTQMTLCVCEAIERFPNNTDLMLNRCCENFTNWYLSNPPDVGGACRRAIVNNKYTNNHKKWLKATYDPESLGNGSLMRTMPIVLSGLGVQAALSQGRLTHNNQTCDVFIEAYYQVLDDILKDKDQQFSPILMEPTGHIYNTYSNEIGRAHV